MKKLKIKLPDFQNLLKGLTKNRKNIIIIFLALLSLVTISSTTYLFFENKDVHEELENEISSNENKKTDENGREDWSLEEVQHEVIFSGLMLASGIFSDIEDEPTISRTEKDIDPKFWTAFGNGDYQYEYTPHSYCGVTIFEEGAEYEIPECPEEALVITNNGQETDVLNYLKKSVNTLNTRDFIQTNDNFTFTAEEGAYFIDTTNQKLYEYIVEGQTSNWDVDIEPIVYENWIFYIFEQDLIGIDTTTGEYKAYNIVQKVLTSYIFYETFGEVELKENQLTITPAIKELRTDNDVFRGYFACESDPYLYMHKIIIDLDTNEMSYEPMADDDCWNNLKP